MGKAVFILLVALLPGLMASVPPEKSKFYDFSEQVIDGEVKKPTTLYTQSRERIKFKRLLKLKKSFIQSLMETSKENAFK